MSPALFALLQSFFDNAFIKVILSDISSYCLLPIADDLQSSIISFSLFVLHQLPSSYASFSPCQRQQSSFTDNSFYKNGVSLISTTNSLQFLLNQCKFHKSLGYRRNPVKSVILIVSDDVSTYTMHSQPIPKQHVFFYLGIFSKHTDILRYLDLASYNTDKINRFIQLLSSIRLSSNCFFKLLLCRLYQQIVRSQIEHGLATFISLVPIIYNWNLPRTILHIVLMAFCVHRAQV